MKKFICLMLAILTGFISGCGLARIPEAHLTESIEDNIENTHEPVEPRPVYGGELNVPLTSLDSFNPLLTKSRDVLNFLGLIYESAITYGKDLKPAPSLVTGWEVSPDGRLWVFDVRKGVKWHNGQDLTGDDILFTLHALQSETLESFFSISSEDIKIVESGLRGGDPYTFYIRLEEPTYRILDYLTFPVLPQNIYASAEFMMEYKEDLTMLPMGSGPYRVDQTHNFDGDTIKLIRNESWWNGTPYIDSINGKLYDSVDEAFNAFYNNEIDLIDTTAVYANTRLYRNSANHIKYNTSDIEMLVFNNNNNLFYDKSVRKAIAYGIDRKDIISKVYLNNAETVDVPIPSNSWLYDSSYRIYDYDEKRAKKLLKEAGWNDNDGDGILDVKQGDTSVDLSFTILTNSDNSWRVDAAELIAEQLTEIGFKVQVEALPWEVLYEERIATGDFDAILIGYSLDPMLNLSSLFHAEWIKYSSPQLDVLLERAADAYTEDDRLNAYQEIQKYLTEEMPVISLYFKTGSLLVDSRINGIEHVGELRIFKDIKNWFIIP
ncbi:MAG: peptide ABC transporter substrate-binding protein [Clostridiales bacterium]|nr:peptide ABC transporter substrate-binding protein [Clostridiales bacterium]